MSKSLVIVESPAKVKTISKFLNHDFTVTSSGGHILDLPKKKMGVDLETFVPEYVVIAAKKKILSALKKESKDKERIYIATDPDREGEAIGWHLKEKLSEKDKKFLRVLFDEITADAIKEAFKHPVELDLNKYNAQQARRVLDRIVGYLLSPLLWKKVAGGLSAGRVQSVALRLIVERERQIQAFVAQEYWEIEAELAKHKDKKVFLARLEKIGDKKAEISNKDDAEKLAEEIKKEKFVVGDIKEIIKRKNPYAPFITSTLQQEAFNRLRFSTQRTMIVAQTLYEGIGLGKEGPVGLITYMRTDSVRVSDVALKQVRDFIGQKFGKDYLPDTPNVYKSKGRTQEAHEAIRPTQVNRTPDSIKDFLTPEQFKLYELIWLRFVASQMKSAEYKVITVDINAGKFLFRWSGSKLLFDGFTVLYKEANEENGKKYLPALTVGEILDLRKLIPQQHFTKPPARFTEASLVKLLDELGIGRPSTYVPVIQTIVFRDYVRRLKGALTPTELGMKVNDLLVENFPKIMDVQFTALMEDELDRIEEGDLSTLEVLREFYEPFSQSLKQAQNNIKKEVIETQETCGLCGKPMVIKWGRFGKFLSCSDFPKCRNAKAITTGVKCPQNCGGELVERAFKGRIFYGCSNYPKCKFTTRKLPEDTEKTKIG